MKNIVVALVVFAALSLAATSNTLAQTFCTGAISGTFNQIVVPPQASCILYLADVSGSVEVQADATLDVESGTTVHGDIDARDCNALNLKGSVFVGRDLKIDSCTMPSGYAGPGIEIGGNFVCNNNSGGCIADGGFIDGDVSITDNTSSNPIDISLNTIRGELDCSGNSLDPIDASGPNRVIKGTEGQCSANGFVTNALPEQQQLINSAGGTIDDSQGDNLNIPSDAVQGVATVSFREMQLNEVQVALETTEFQGQRLTYLDAVDIELSPGMSAESSGDSAAPGLSFREPISISIPNASGLPATAQIVVARIERNTDGDNIPHFVVVDAASIDGDEIHDGNVDFPGVMATGRYVFLRLNEPMQYVGGTAQDGAERPVKDAAIESFDFPDFRAQSDSAGKFVLIVPANIQTTGIAGADKAFSFYGFGTFPITGNPGLASPLVFNFPSKQISPGSGVPDIECQHEYSFDEQALNFLADNVLNQFENDVRTLAGTSETVPLTLNPNPVLLGGGSTATADVGGYIQEAISPGISGSVQLQLRKGIAWKFLSPPVNRVAYGVQYSLATPAVDLSVTGLESVNQAVVDTAGIARVPQSVFSPTPQWTINPKSAGNTDIVFTLFGARFAAPLQLNIEDVGCAFSQPLEIPALTVAPESENFQINTTVNLQVLTPSAPTANAMVFASPDRSICDFPSSIPPCLTATQSTTSLPFTLVRDIPNLGSGFAQYDGTQVILGASAGDQNAETRGDGDANLAGRFVLLSTMIPPGTVVPVTAVVGVTTDILLTDESVGSPIGIAGQVIWDVGLEFDSSNTVADATLHFFSFMSNSCDTCFSGFFETPDSYVVNFGISDGVPTLISSPATITSSQPRPFIFSNTPLTVNLQIPIGQPFLINVHAHANADTGIPSAFVTSNAFISKMTPAVFNLPMGVSVVAAE